MDKITRKVVMLRYIFLTKIWIWQVQSNCCLKCSKETFYYWIRLINNNYRGKRLILFVIDFMIILQASVCYLEGRWGAVPTRRS